MAPTIKQGLKEDQVSWTPSGDRIYDHRQSDAARWGMDTGAPRTGTFANTNAQLRTVPQQAPLTGAPTTQPIAQPIAQPTNPFYAPGYGQGTGSSTAPDQLRKTYFDYVNDLRNRGIDTPNPIDKTGMPERDPYSGQAWTPSGAAQFQRDMAQAHRPFVGGEGLIKWEENFVYQRMNPGQATTTQHAGNFLTTKGMFADDFALKNMNRVSDNAKTAYKERCDEFDVAFSELLKRRGGSLTADEATGIAEELYSQFGDQIGRHMQNRISTTLQRSTPDVWQAIQKQKQEGMMMGNQTFRDRPKAEQAQIKLDLDILRNAAEEGAKANIPAPDAKVDPDAKKKPMMPGIPPSIAARYGLDADGISPDVAFKSIGKLFGLEARDQNPHEPKPMGTLQINKGVKVEMMNDGTQRIDPSWAEKTTDPAQIKDAYQQMLDEDKKATGEGGKPLLSPADRVRYQERADAYEKALSATTVQQGVSPTTKPAAQPNQPQRKAAKRFFPWLIDPPAVSGGNAIPTNAEFNRDMEKLKSHFMDALGLSDSSRAEQHAKDTKNAEIRYREHAKTGDYHRIPTSWLKHHQGEYNDIPARLLK